jgi:hypothetical protein
MRTDLIEKRLAAAEQKRKRPVTIVCRFPSRADSCAYYLSGGMLKNEPGVYELTWGNEQPTTDIQNIRWLKQYTPAQIDEIRREWEASTFERDKIALLELDRLLPMISQETAETR